jgi:hypothetical protein
MIVESMRQTTPLLVATILVAGCIPIPAKHQEQVTPAVVGTLTLDSGTPAARYFVAATDGDEDRTCSRPGGRGVTDSLGRFGLPATSEEKKIFWFTMMENLGMRGYWLCARPASSGASGDAPAAAPSRTYVFGHFVGDTVNCLQWRWRDTMRLSCNASPNTKQILQGGNWTEGDVSGSYRVLFVVPVGRWAAEGRAVVQWVGRSSGTPNTVRAQMDLPTRDSVEVLGASLDHVGDAWHVRVKSVRRTTWGNDIWLTYELGSPGVIHEIREK